MIINKKKYLTVNELIKLATEFNETLQTDSNFLSWLDFTLPFNFIEVYSEPWLYKNEKKVVVKDNFSDKWELLAFTNSKTDYLKDDKTHKYVTKQWFTDTFNKEQFLPLIRKMDQLYKNHNFKIIKTQFVKDLQNQACIICYDDDYYFITMDNLLNLHWTNLLTNNKIRIDDEVLTFLATHDNTITYKTDDNDLFKELVIKVANSYTKEEQKLRRTKVNPTYE